jgi:hypothetical protein
MRSLIFLLLALLFFLVRGLVDMEAEEEEDDSSRRLSSTTSTTSSNRFIDPKMTQIASGWFIQSFFRSKNCAGLSPLYYSLTSLSSCDATRWGYGQGSSNSFDCKYSVNALSLVRNSFLDTQCTSPEQSPTVYGKQLSKVVLHSTSMCSEDGALYSCSADAASHSFIYGVHTTYYRSSTCDASTIAAKRIFPFNF